MIEDDGRNPGPAGTHVPQTGGVKTTTVIGIVALVFFVGLVLGLLEMR